MAESAPLDNSVTASILNGQPYDLVQEIYRGVRDQFPGATPAEVADEVRLRLDRLERAWQATRGQCIASATSPMGTPLHQAQPWSRRSAICGYLPGPRGTTGGVHVPEVPGYVKPCEVLPRGP